MKAKGVMGIGFALMCMFGLTVNAAVAEELRINGSTTVLPITQKVAEAYMKENPDVKIAVSGGGSGNGIKALIDGTTDIAMSSRAMKDKEITLAEEKGIDARAVEIAYDCIVPIVHPTNSVADLTLEQLKAIYMGTVKNWKEVGGPDLQIVVVSRDTSSGTYEVWEEKVMAKERVYPGALLQASSGAVAQAISNNKNAVGYIGYGYLNDKIKPLTVNGIEGNPETTLNGTFPISRPLYYYTKGKPAGEVEKFVNYVLSEPGQKDVKEAGFVPLK